MSKKGEKGWQFPDNNCTNNYGLEDAGTETFAGDSDGGLARERYAKTLLMLIKRKVSQRELNLRSLLSQQKIFLGGVN